MAGKVEGVQANITKLNRLAVLYPVQHIVSLDIIAYLWCVHAAET